MFKMNLLGNLITTALQSKLNVKTSFISKTRKTQSGRRCIEGIGKKIIIETQIIYFRYASNADMLLPPALLHVMTFSHIFFSLGSSLIEFSLQLLKILKL